MGVPALFKKLQSFGQNLIRKIDEQERWDVLVIDTNSIIHPCCRIEGKGKTWAKRISNVKKVLIRLIEIMDPKEVYLMIDGIAPHGKMIQQRRRRKTQTTDEEDGWGSHMITPGTQFMEELLKELRTIEIEGKSVLISGQDEEGEGEHKWYKYAEDHKSYVMYGLDADLIVITLQEEIKNISIIREKDYQKEKTVLREEMERKEFEIIDVKKMRDVMVRWFDPTGKKERKRVLCDIMFLLSFLGNDFMPKGPSLNLSNHGLEILREGYKSINGYLVEETEEDIKINPIQLQNMLKVQEIGCWSRTKQYVENQRRKHQNGGRKEKIEWKVKCAIEYSDPDVFGREQCAIYMRQLLWCYGYYRQHISLSDSFYAFIYPPHITILLNYLKTTPTIEISKKNRVKTVEMEQMINYVMPEEGNPWRNGDVETVDNWAVYEHEQASVPIPLTLSEYEEVITYQNQNQD